jgi:hypothetical protein
MPGWLWDRKFSNYEKKIIYNDLTDNYEPFKAENNHEFEHYFRDAHYAGWNTVDYQGIKMANGYFFVGAPFAYDDIVEVTYDFKPQGELINNDEVSGKTYLYFRVKRPNMVFQHEIPEIGRMRKEGDKLKFYPSDRTYNFISDINVHEDYMYIVEKYTQYKPEKERNAAAEKVMEDIRQEFKAKEQAEKEHKEAVKKWSENLSREVEEKMRKEREAKEKAARDAREKAKRQEEARKREEYERRQAEFQKNMEKRFGKNFYGNPYIYHANKIREEEKRRKAEEEARQKRQRNSKINKLMEDELFRKAKLMYLVEIPYTMETIKKKRKELVKKNHPDMGGSEAICADVNRMFDVLVKFASNGEKK